MVLQDTEKQELLDKIYHLLEKHELPITIRFLKDLHTLFEPKSKDEMFTLKERHSGTGY